MNILDGGDFMAHVFVVDKDTFKVHLEYLFAGTGAGKHKSPFLNDPKTRDIHHSRERNLVGMIADISRVKKGDNIIFYVQGIGKFYGVFVAASDAFFDENDENNYLVKDLKKGLSFRIKIEPKEVYSKGVTEFQYLDSLSGIKKPHEMCWSLIYRKLKGNRGCTMITDKEFESLVDKLKIENENLAIKAKGYTYNSIEQIIEKKNEINQYLGRKESINIKDRMVFKAKNNNAFETHLQAYILQNLENIDLKDLIVPKGDNKEVWLGNEVSCGVGMQRIDILIIKENKEDIIMNVIELKCIEPYLSIITYQLPRYINWVCDYIIPNYDSRKTVYINPITIALADENVRDKEFYTLGTQFDLRTENTSNNVHINQLQYIGFKVLDSNIEFSRKF